MKTLQWGAEYLTGVPEIDDQHKEFVNIINKLYWAEEKQLSREFGARLIYELMKYAEFHFTCEENLMYLHQYPGLESQVGEHRKLLSVIKMKISDFQAGKADYDSISKFAFMWLISHTTEEDKKFSKSFQTHVQQTASSPPPSAPPPQIPPMTQAIGKGDPPPTRRWG